MDTPKYHAKRFLVKLSLIWVDDALCGWTMSWDIDYFILISSTDSDPRVRDLHAPMSRGLRDLVRPIWFLCVIWRRRTPRRNPALVKWKKKYHVCFQLEKCDISEKKISYLHHFVCVIWNIIILLGMCVIKTIIVRPLFNRPIDKLLFFLSDLFSCEFFPCVLMFEHFKTTSALIDVEIV